MRIKNDFVTNSSTSSFIVWGISTDFHELEKNKKIADAIYDKYLNNATGEIETREEFFDNIDKYDFLDVIQDLVGKYNLEATMPPYDDVVYIGICPFSIGDNETGLEFKMRVKNALEELGFNEEPGRIEEAWMDG